MEMLINKNDIQNKVSEIAFDLSREVENATFLVVTTGATLFAADLFKKYTGIARMDFIKVKSYQGEEQMPVRLIHGPMLDLNEEDTVIIVEDIVDSGNTIEYIKKYLRTRGVVKTLVVSLLYKERSKHLVDYPGFLIKEDDFIFGYGLDLDEYDRNTENIWKK